MKSISKLLLLVSLVGISVPVVSMESMDDYTELAHQLVIGMQDTGTAAAVVAEVVQEQIEPSGSYWQALENAKDAVCSAVARGVALCKENPVITAAVAVPVTGLVLYKGFGGKTAQKKTEAVKNPQADAVQNDNNDEDEVEEAQIATTTSSQPKASGWSLPFINKMEEKPEIMAKVEAALNTERKREFAAQYAAENNTFAFEQFSITLEEYKAYQEWLASQK